MPSTGQSASCPCPECGGVRRWAYGVTLGKSQGLSTTLDGALREFSKEYAYRCEKGHVSDTCPNCYSRDTTRYRPETNSPRGVVMCQACGDVSPIIVIH
jgi:RNase P subunit RPR2